MSVEAAELGAGEPEAVAVALDPAEEVALPEPDMAEDLLAMAELILLDAEPEGLAVTLETTELTTADQKRELCWLVYTNSFSDQRLNWVDDYPERLRQKRG